VDGARGRAHNFTATAHRKAAQRCILKAYSRIKGRRPHRKLSRFPPTHPLRTAPSARIQKPHGSAVCKVSYFQDAQLCLRPTHIRRASKLLFMHGQDCSSTEGKKRRIVSSHDFSTALAFHHDVAQSRYAFANEPFGLKGWQWLFIFEGLPTIITGILVLKWLSDGPQKADWMEPQERLACQRLAAERATKEAVHHFTVKEALTHPRVLALGVVYFGAVIGLYGLSLWLPNSSRALA
jgi:hypothetical protein